MQEQISLSANFVQLARQLGFSNARVAEELSKEILQQPHRLAAALHTFRQHRDRGAIVEDSVELEDDSDGLLLNEDGTGTIPLKFGEEAYYGCRDADAFEDHSEVVDFTIDLGGHRVILEVPDEPERDPDEF